MSEKNKVLNIIKSVLKIESVDDITKEHTLNALGANPFDVIEISMQIEEFLDIVDIENEGEEEWTVMTTVNQIIKFAESV